MGIEFGKSGEIKPQLKGTVSEETLIFLIQQGKLFGWENVNDVLAGIGSIPDIKLDIKNELDQLDQRARLNVGRLTKSYTPGTERVLIDGKEYSILKFSNSSNFGFAPFPSLIPHAIVSQFLTSSSEQEKLRAATLTPSRILSTIKTIDPELTLNDALRITNDNLRSLGPLVGYYREVKEERWLYVLKSVIYNAPRSPAWGSINH